MRLSLHLALSPKACCIFRALEDSEPARARAHGAVSPTSLACSSKATSQYLSLDCGEGWTGYIAHLMFPCTEPCTSPTISEVCFWALQVLSSCQAACCEAIGAHSRCGGRPCTAGPDQTTAPYNLGSSFCDICLGSPACWYLFQHAPMWGGVRS